jgi:hypothetical protein
LASSWLSDIGFCSEPIACSTNTMPAVQQHGGHIGAGLVDRVIDRGHPAAAPSATMSSQDAGRQQIRLRPPGRGPAQTAQPW